MTLLFFISFDDFKHFFAFCSLFLHHKHREGSKKDGRLLLLFVERNIGKSFHLIEAGGEFMIVAHRNAIASGINLRQTVIINDVRAHARYI